MKTLFHLLLVGVLFGAVLPAFAQELGTDERELLDYVAAAYENLLQIETFKAETVQDMTQDIALSMGGQQYNVHQVISQSAALQVRTANGNPAQMGQVMSQTTTVESDVPGMAMQELFMEMEGVLYDGEFYMRLSDASAQITVMFPRGWFLARDYPEIAGINMGVVDELNGREALSIYPLTPQTVIAIKELPSEEIDGVTLRVFELIFDTETLFSETPLGGMLDPSAFGADGDQIIANLINGTNFSQRVWIDPAEQVVVRSQFVSVMEDVVMSLQGQEMNMSQTTDALTIFAGFGDPVTIEEPILGE